MLKVVLKIQESEINYLLRKLAKLGIKNIKITKKEKELNLFRYKNMLDNSRDELMKKEDK